MATTYILDLRPTDEFNNVHLPGAHNIPFNEIDFENLPFKPNQDVMVYCRGRLCGYADCVGKKLKAKGYKRVSVFNHSVAEWQNENNFQTSQIADGFTDAQHLIKSIILIGNCWIILHAPSPLLILTH